MTTGSLDLKGESNTQKLILFSYLPYFPSHTGVFLFKLCTTHITQTLGVEKKNYQQLTKDPQNHLRGVFDEGSKATLCRVS